MTGDGEEETQYALAEHQLGRLGLQVKLDKGFEEGCYCVYVEFDALGSRVGFAAAHRLASEYCNLLKGQLGRSTGYALRETEDPSRSGDPRRKRDLEATFLSFAVESGDGHFHDDAVKEQFRVAFLRSDQAWDQSQARVQTLRRQSRQERFRRQLAGLLESGAFADVGADAKARLLEEIPALAFPAKDLEP